MATKIRRRSPLITAIPSALLVAGLAAGPAVAIVDGEPDVTNVHANVGAVEYLFEGPLGPRLHWDAHRP